MNIITANDLKAGGVALIEANLKEMPELMICVEGKNRFIVMEVEHYQQLQEAQTLATWQAAKNDINNGLFHTDIDEHLEKIKQAIEL